MALHPGTYDECKRKVLRGLSANRLCFPEFSYDISLVLDVGRLICVVVDSLVSAAKECNCAISSWCWQTEFRYVVAWLSSCTRIFCACHNNVSSVISLADCALENQFSTQVYSFSGLLALNHRPIFVDKKVVIRVGLCFNQFVVYSMRNHAVYRTAKKQCFAN